MCSSPSFTDWAAGAVFSGLITATDPKTTGAGADENLQLLTETETQTCRQGGNGVIANKNKREDLQSLSPSDDDYDSDQLECVGGGTSLLPQHEINLKANNQSKVDAQAPEIDGDAGKKILEDNVTKDGNNSMNGTKQVKAYKNLMLTAVASAQTQSISTTSSQDQSEIQLPNNNMGEEELLRSNTPTTNSTTEDLVGEGNSGRRLVPYSEWASSVVFSGLFVEKIELKQTKVKIEDQSAKLTDTHDNKCNDSDGMKSKQLCKKFMLKAVAQGTSTQAASKELQLFIKPEVKSPKTIDLNHDNKKGGGGLSWVNSAQNGLRKGNGGGGAGLSWVNNACAGLKPTNGSTSQWKNVEKEDNIDNSSKENADKEYSSPRVRSSVKNNHVEEMKEKLKLIKKRKDDSNNVSPSQVNEPVLEEKPQISSMAEKARSDALPTEKKGSPGSQSATFNEWASSIVFLDTMKNKQQNGDDAGESKAPTFVGLLSMGGNGDKNNIDCSVVNDDTPTSSSKSQEDAVSSTIHSIHDPYSSSTKLDTDELDDMSDEASFCIGQEEGFCASRSINESDISETASEGDSEDDEDALLNAELARLDETRDANDIDSSEGDGEDDEDSLLDAELERLDETRDADDTTVKTHDDAETKFFLGNSPITDGSHNSDDVEITPQHIVNPDEGIIEPSTGAEYNNASNEDPSIPDNGENEHILDSTNINKLSIGSEENEEQPEMQKSQTSSLNKEEGRYPYQEWATNIVFSGLNTKPPSRNCLDRDESNDKVTEAEMPPLAPRTNDIEGEVSKKLLLQAASAVSEQKRAAFDGWDGNTKLGSNTLEKDSPNREESGRNILSSNNMKNVLLQMKQKDEQPDTQMSQAIILDKEVEGASSKVVPYQEWATGIVFCGLFTDNKNAGEQSTEDDNSEKANITEGKTINIKNFLLQVASKGMPIVPEPNTDQSDAPLMITASPSDENREHIDEKTRRVNEAGDNSCGSNELSSLFDHSKSRSDSDAMKTINIKSLLLRAASKGVPTKQPEPSEKQIDSLNKEENAPSSKDVSFQEWATGVVFSGLFTDNTQGREVNIELTDGSTGKESSLQGHITSNVGDDDMKAVDVKKLLLQVAANDVTEMPEPTEPPTKPPITIKAAENRDHPDKTIFSRSTNEEESSSLDHGVGRNGSATKTAIKGIANDGDSSKSIPSHGDETEDHRNNVDTSDNRIPSLAIMKSVALIDPDTEPINGSNEIHAKSVAKKDDLLREAAQCMAGKSEEQAPTKAKSTQSEPYNEWAASTVFSGLHDKKKYAAQQVEHYVGNDISHQCTNENDIQPDQEPVPPSTTSTVNMDSDEIDITPESHRVSATSPEMSPTNKLEELDQSEDKAICDHEAELAEKLCENLPPGSAKPFTPFSEWAAGSVFGRTNGRIQRRDSDEVSGDIGTSVHSDKSMDFSQILKPPAPLKRSRVTFREHDSVIQNLVKSGTSIAVSEMSMDLLSLLDGDMAGPDIADGLPKRISPEDSSDLPERGTSALDLMGQSVGNLAFNCDESDSSLPHTNTITDTIKEIQPKEYTIPLERPVNVMIENATLSVEDRPKERVYTDFSDSLPERTISEYSSDLPERRATTMDLMVEPNDTFDLNYDESGRSGSSLPVVESHYILQPEGKEALQPRSPETEHNKKMKKSRSKSCNSLGRPVKKRVPKGADPDKKDSRRADKYYSIPKPYTTSITKEKAEDRVGLMFADKGRNILLMQISEISPFRDNLLIKDELLVINGHRVKNAEKGAELIKASRGNISISVLRGKRPRESELDMLRLSKHDFADLQLFSHNNMVHVIRAEGRFAKSGRIKAGDICLTINGTPVCDAESALQLLREGVHVDSKRPYRRGLSEWDLKSSRSSSQEQEETGLVIMLVYSKTKLRRRIIKKIGGKLVPVEWNKNFTECSLRGRPKENSQRLMRIHNDGNCEDLIESQEEINPTTLKDLQAFSKEFYLRHQKSMKELADALELASSSSNHATEDVLPPTN